MKNWLFPSCFIGSVLALGIPLCAQAAVTLAGVGKSMEKQISDHLQSVTFPCDTPASAANRILKQLDTELTYALRALGYFNADFSRQIVFNAACWEASYTIRTGAPALVRKSNIQIVGMARENPAIQADVTSAALQPGALFNSISYEDLKEKISSVGPREGYFDATFSEQQVDIYPAENAVDINLVWQSGDRYRYGDITIQQSVLRPELFLRLLSFQQGDPYDLAILQDDRIRLGESQYYDVVEIKPLLEQAHDRVVPVQINTSPGSLSSYQVGAGFATDTGPRLRGDYARHVINRYGHQADIKLLTSQVLNSANLVYTSPWRDPRTDSLRANVSYISEDNDSFSSTRWESSLTESTILGNNWNQALSLTLSTEKSIFADSKADSVHLVPAVNWSKTVADNVVYPEHGYSASLIVLGSLQQLLSDSSFAQVEVSAKWITMLPRDFRLLLRGNLGFTLVDSIDDLPASRRFYTGGDNSIRGYDYQSLGPGENGEVSGGRNLVVGSIEIEHPLYQKWSVAAFADAGNAWNEDEFEAVIGVGAGLRWRSPIGPLRIDVGMPLVDSDANFRVHLQIGPDL